MSVEFFQEGPRVQIRTQVEPPRPGGLLGIFVRLGLARDTEGAMKVAGLVATILFLIASYIFIRYVFFPSPEAFSEYQGIVDIE